MSNFVDYDNAVELFTEVGNKRKTSESMQENLLKSTVGWTGKNLLKNEAKTQTANGITWTVNDDGTVLINGTNTDNSYLTVNNRNISLDVDTEYILSGNTTENADEWYLSLFLQVGYEGMTDYRYIFNNNPTGVKFKLRDLIGESNLTSLRCYARVGIPHGAQTVDNVTFYPMLRDADITDDTYEPYHESVEEEIEQIYADNGVLGAKNLLPNNAISQTRNGVTFTVNADGSITANGTATEQINFSITGANYTYNLQEDAIISGSKDGGTATTYEVIFWDDTAQIAYRSREGVDALIPTANVYGHRVSASFMVRSGAVLDNVTVYPMLRLASDPDDTYVPYAMTNKELTESVTSKALSFTLSTANAILLRNDSRIKGDIVNVRVQLQVTSEIASETELIRNTGTPHVGFGVTILGNTNTGNLYETYVPSSSSNLSFTAKNAIPEGYYSLNYTYIQ